VHLFTRTEPARPRHYSTRPRFLLAAIAVPLLVMAGMTIAAPADADAPSGTLDQSNPNTGAYGYIPLEPAEDMVQTFTAGISGTLPAVELGEYAGTNNGAGTVQIVTVNQSGTPTQDVLATAALPANPAGGWATVDFTSPPQVLAGTQYGIVIDPSAEIDVQVSNGDVYPRGAIYYGGMKDAGGPGVDFIFMTYVDTSNNAAPTLSGTPDSTIINGRSYSYGYTAGGSPAPVVAVASGALPPGLQLSQAGVLSGTPTTNGDYHFTVQAANGVGTVAGVDSEITVRDAKVPGAPTIGTATTGNGQATIAFTAPADPGDASINSYTVTSSPDGITATGTSSPITITGLTNGTAYTFTVDATSDIGTSDPSTASNSVTPRTVPDAPTDLIATPQSHAVQLSWTPPASNGGATITGYEIEDSTDGRTWLHDDNSVGTSDTIGNVTNGTTYYFRVAAINLAGTGAWSESENTTPSTVPDAPTWASTVAGDGEADLTWNAPADGGAEITGYTVQQSTNQADWTDAATTTTALTAAITPLDNGTLYYFRIIATNAAGDGLPSSTDTVTPRTTPGAPTFDSAIPGNGSVALSWTPPSSNGGANVTGYDVRYGTDGRTWTDAPTPAGTSTTVSALANGTEYTFEVRAENSAGPGDWSAIGTAIPRTTPGAPAAPQTTGSDGAVELAWTAPTTDGGATITGYDIQYRQTGTTTWIDGASGASSPASITGLTNGTSYDFRIAATNAAGTGDWSDPVTAIPFLFAVTFDNADGHSIEGSTLSVGDHVVVSGGDLPPGATVTVVLHSTPVTLGATTVATDGSFHLDLVIPAGTSSGSHQLVATITGSGGTTTNSSVTFSVAANSLAFTGTSVPWVPVGLTLIVLVGLGTALLLMRRRRSA
jgi:hypothetical protein